MKLTTFTDNGATRLGVVVGDTVRDLSRIAPGLPVDMVAFLEGGEEAMRIARASASRIDAAIPLEDVLLEAPVLRPRKFLGIGANYPREGAPPVHGRNLQEMQSSPHQVWFNKQVTCVNGPYDPIKLPSVSKELIYEAELAFVIGRRCRHVPKEAAPRVIAGYLVCNDLTVVDWALQSPTVMLGKSFDTHGPIGPWLVTPDEVGDPHALRVRSYVNGEERQDGSTSSMKYDCFDMVAYLSKVFTLEPGDILTTGTPSRVSQFLKAGDVVRCEVDRIGHIENVVVAES